FQVPSRDSEKLELNNHTFDAIPDTFAGRVFESVERIVSIILPVIKPAVHGLNSALSAATDILINQVSRFHNHNLTPTLGKLISKDASAYSYLPESVVNFADGERFAAITKKVGFGETKVRPQTFGFCAIYECTIQHLPAYIPDLSLIIINTMALEQSINQDIK